MLEVRGLTKSYPSPLGRRYVFRDLNFRFPPQANIGLIGRNGAGKSTLLRLLGGIDTPDHGEIVTDARISFPIGLAGGLNANLSGRENCEFVCRIHGAWGREMREKIDYVRAFAEIGDYFELPVKSYSSGMRSRLTFGLSMAFDFDVYLIDEVMAVGDAQFREKSRQVLVDKLSRANVILTSHNMADIRQFCNIVVRVSPGGEVQVHEDIEDGIRAYSQGTAQGSAPAAAPAPGPFERPGNPMKWLTSLRSRSLLLALVAVPVLLYALYLALVASDRYVSESVIAVRQAGSDGGNVPGAALLLAGLNPPSREDTLYLKAFVHSRSLMLELDAALGLRTHFGAARADWPFVLASDASREEFAEYFRKRVEVSFDNEATLLRIRTQGFDADFAQRLNKGILDASERFVNETSQRMARERLRFAEGELALAGERLAKARDAVLAFQSRHQLLDPAAQAQATGALTAELEASRTRLQAELGGLLAYLNEDAFQVQALRARIAALDRQIDAERARATTDGRRGERLTSLAVQFQGLQLQAQFAQDAYKLAAVAVENARIDATRKIKSLLVVEPPSQPEEAEYPLKLYNLTTLLVVCLLLFGITRLVLTTIREHQD